MGVKIDFCAPTIKIVTSLSWRLWSCIRAWMHFTVSLNVAADKVQRQLPWILLGFLGHKVLWLLFLSHFSDNLSLRGTFFFFFLVLAKFLFCQNCFRDLCQLKSEFLSGMLVWSCFLPFSTSPASSGPFFTLVPFPPVLNYWLRSFYCFGKYWILKTDTSRPLPKLQNETLGVQSLHWLEPIFSLYFSF